MREDMHKVIVERPRWGNKLKSRGGRRARFADMQSKIGSRRFIAITETNTKALSENLAPLRRYLAKQVGRPWCKVYSEICANLHPGHTVKQHLLEHLGQFVAYRLGIGRDRELLDSSSYLGTWRQDLYVDPVDGILKDSAKYWRKCGIEGKPWKHWGRKDEADPDVLRVSDDQELHRIAGLWFAVVYRQCAEDLEQTHVYDVVKKHSVPAGRRYAVSKRQLSARELAEHGLHNDNQEIDDKVPQRHKRKRKRKRP